MKAFWTENRYANPGRTSYGPQSDTRSSFRNISSTVEFRARLTPGSMQSDHTRMSRVAGSQLMVCGSTVGAAGPLHPVTFTTVAHECVYLGCLRQVWEPNTRTKYRSPRVAVIAAVCRGEMSSAGVGGFFANAAHPLAAHPHAIASKTARLGRDMGSSNGKQT